jgi:hypothetical protein
MANTLNKIGQVLGSMAQPQNTMRNPITGVVSRTGPMDEIPGSPGGRADDLLMRTGERSKSDDLLMRTGERSRGIPLRSPFGIFAPDTSQNYSIRDMAPADRKQ